MRAALLALTVVFITPIAPAAAETTIHVIMVADTNDKNIGHSVWQDVSHMRDVFDANVPARQLNFQSLIGADCNANAILNHIAARRIDTDDVVVFAFSGHGGYNAQSNQHTFAIDTRLERSVVRNALLRKSPRLTVLLTDSCSSVDPPRDMTSPDTPGPVSLTPLFRALFFETRGLVDISSTRPGETAWGGPAGGNFTIALAQTLSNSNRRLNWSQTLSEVRTRALAIPRADNGVQTAYAVSPLPGLNVAAAAQVQQAPGRTYYLGVSTALTNRAAAMSGVEVRSVTANSPATRIIGGNGVSYRLVPNRDIITHVNNQPATSPQELARLVRSAGPNAVLRVYDSQTRSFGDYSVRLGVR